MFGKVTELIIMMIMNIERNSKKIITIRAIIATTKIYDKKKILNEI